jgi:hypothetical protein
LNADLLDGQQGSYYLNYNNFSNLPTIGTGVLTVAVGSGMTVSTGATFGANDTGNKTITLTHATPTTVASNISASTNTFISGATFDSFGHVTAASTGSIDFTVAANYAFQNASISTDSGYTWGTANTNTTQAADSSSDTLTLVAGTYINLYTSTVAGTDAIKIEHADTSTLSGAQGSAGIASITVDGAGHVTAVSTATYLTSYTESDTLQTVTDRGKTTTNDITITNATASTGTSTGALKVTGGVGITGALYVGGAGNFVSTLSVSSTATMAAINASGVLTVTNHTNSTSTTTGALIVQGGVGITGALYAGSTINVAGTATMAAINASGVVTISNHTDSTSENTGALQVQGGLGVTGNAYIKGDAHILGNLYVEGDSTIMNTSQVTIEDTILWLGGTAGSTAGDTFDKGVIFSYWNGIASQLGYFGWDESLDSFAVYQSATETSGVMSGTLGKITGATFVGYLDGNALTATTASKVANSVTFNNSGSGDASGTTFDGSTARTISYNTLGAASSGHVHGNITNTGTISTTATPASGDYILISDATASNAVVQGPAIGSGTTTYLRNDGTWGTPSGTYSYTLPTATSSVLGGIKLWSDTDQSVAANAVTTTAGRTYGAQLNASDQFVINVPWTNNSYLFASGTTNGAFQVTPFVDGVTGSAQSVSIYGLGSNAYTSTAYLPLAGGSLTGPVTSSSTISITNSTASTSTSTGALVITGGVGIGGALYVGGAINGASLATSGNATISGDAYVTGSIINKSGSTNVSANAVNTITLATVSTTAIDTFAFATYRSAKYLVQITQGTNYQVSEVLVIHNGTTTYSTEYGVIETNGALATITTAINGANVELRVTMGTATSATIRTERLALNV